MRIRKRTDMSEPPHPVEAVPRLRHLLPLGLQHVLVAYAGMATTPLLIGIGLGLSTDQIAALVTANVLVSGVATLIQTLGILNIGVRMPVVMGSTFTGITPAIIIGKDSGLPAVFGATIVAGFLTWIAAPWFSQILRFFPPIVTGTVIAIIGFSLLPSTATMIAGDDLAAPDYGSGPRLLLALLTIAMVLLLQRFTPPKVNRFAILLALLLGTLVAIPFGLVDVSSVGEAEWVGMVTPFAFGAPEFTISAILPMIVVQLVNMVESTGDTLAIGAIVEKPVGPRQIAKALRADGVGTIFAGFFNSFTMVTFGNNVGLVSFTRVMSRFVVATAGVMLIVLGLLPKLGALVASLPGPVLGGIGVVILGTVGAIGVRIMLQADLTDMRNVLLVAISFGFGMMPVGAPEFYDQMPVAVQTVLGSGISAGGISAFTLNLLFNHRRDGVGAATVEDTSTTDGTAQQGESAA